MDSDRLAAPLAGHAVMEEAVEVVQNRRRTHSGGCEQPLGVAGVDRDGRPRLYTACGILMHSSLAVTTDGLPLGLTAIKFWSREKFKGTNALKKKINPTRVPIEKEGEHPLAR